MRSIKFSFFKIFFYLVYAFVFIAFINLQVSAEPVFEDNFDDHADWSPTQTSNSSAVTCAVSQGCTTAPEGYDGYRMGTSYYTNAGNNTLNIDSSNFRGVSGKAFTFWNETCDSCGWASDGLLDVKLNSEGYDQIYVRYFIKFDPNWQWNSSQSPMQKFIHASNYDGVGSQWRYFQDGSHHPLSSGGLSKWNNGSSDISHYGAFRYENVYYSADATPPRSEQDVFYFGNGNYGGTGDDFWDQGMLGDGEWHSFEYFYKLNSEVGVADGEYRFWLDGNLVAEVTNLAWGDEGAQISPRKKWNYVQIGGNNFNHYAPQSEESEQFYAIDDLVISTTYVGPDYVIGGASLFKDGFEYTE